MTIRSGCGLLISSIFCLLSLLVRSGLEVLSAHPRLYWNDHCTPGSEWLKFTKKRRSTDRLWTASDEETSFPPLIALPGRENLGLGRHWHFIADFAWLLTGLVYVVMLFFAAPEWRRLIPTSWQIVPDAGRAMLSYLTLHIVEAPGTYNALQQLSYAAVVFLLAPFSMATGIAMSPAIAARFPWYIKIFHGRQGARSLHFLALCAFTLFFIGHVALVVLHGFRKGLAVIVFRGNAQSAPDTALWLSGCPVWPESLNIPCPATTMCSAPPRALCPERHPDDHRSRCAHCFSVMKSPAALLTCGYLAILLGQWTRTERGPLPGDGARDNFADYILEAGGLVETPVRLTLADLRAMPKQTQVTKHCCIQGWSGVAEWSGVSLSHIVALCRPLPAARYIVFYAFDNKSTSEPHAQGPGYFYGTIRLELAKDPQTILAYEMNGQPLPIDHGAPLRLRVETQLGFTMVKYIRAIEFVENYEHIGRGQGGWREDYQYFSQEAGI